MNFIQYPLYFLYFSLGKHTFWITYYKYNVQVTFSPRLGYQSFAKNNVLFVWIDDPETADFKVEPAFKVGNGDDASCESCFEIYMLSVKQIQVSSCEVGMWFDVDSHDKVPGNLIEFSRLFAPFLEHRAFACLSPGFNGHLKKVCFGDIPRATANGAPARGEFTTAPAHTARSLKNLCENAHVKVLCKIPSTTARIAFHIAKSAHPGALHTYFPRCPAIDLLQGRLESELDIFFARYCRRLSRVPAKGV